jgi:putative Mg2+ transporter-C (MgtC) family protein
MIVSAKVASIGGYDPDTTRVDPGRIAAGIVTGIGFLGAGVVIRLGDLVRGVTTAATIWFTAGLGIAIGSGAYGLATVATVTALVVLWSFNGIERLVRAPVYRVVVLEVAVEHGKALEHQARLLIEGGGARVMDTRANLDVEEGISTLQLHVRAPPKFGVRDLVESLGGEAGVRRAAWE